MLHSPVLLLLVKFAFILSYYAVKIRGTKYYIRTVFTRSKPVGSMAVLQRLSTIIYFQNNKYLPTV